MELLFGPGTPAPLVVEERREGGDTASITVDVPPAPGSRRMLLIRARRAPEREYITPAFSLAPRARLRFGVGLSDAGRRDAAPVPFSLAVVRGGGPERIWQRDLDPARVAWEDHEVDLGRWAGETVALRFEAGGEALAFPLWSDPTVYAPVASAPNASPTRNVLLISLDTLRADRLGCYGYPRPTSPTIDRELAARGARFANAFTPYPSTAAAHMTLLTGLDPCVHRIVGHDDPPLPEGTVALAERLRAAGWETAAFTENGLIQAAKGFARGFGQFVEDRSSERHGAAKKTFARARAFIEAQRGRPWALFVHTYQVHSPYEPPPGYVAAIGVEGSAGDSDRYDAEIRYTDTLLADLLRDLERLGEAERTAIVLTSDHGEHFGEHGLTGHNNSLHRQLLHVPLVIRAPGAVAAGRTVSSPVGLADVPATILDLLGLPPARWSHGSSVLALLNGPAPARERWAQLGMPARTIALHGDLKWIVDASTAFGHRFALNDAREQRRPSPLRVPHVVQRFREHCDAVPLRPPAAPAAAPAEVDTDLRDKLRALGYLQ
jgi:hypothetical protein